MKRVVMMMVMGLAAGVAMGGADDTLVAFETKGPDKYLDGTVVKDGESYALVWTANGAAFAGIAADGKAIGDGSKVIVFAPVAKGGKCPPVLFELDAELAAQYAGGSYALYLLDTRLANGELAGFGADGAPVAVNGYGKVGSEGQGDNGGGEGSVAEVTEVSAVPEGTPRPQITAIRLVGDNVMLTVKGTVPCLKYAAAAVGSEASGGNAAVQGAGSAEEEIVVIAPKSGEKGLWRVGRE